MAYRIINKINDDIKPIYEEVTLAEHEVITTLFQQTHIKYYMRR